MTLDWNCFVISPGLMINETGGLANKAYFLTTNCIGKYRQFKVVLFHGTQFNDPWSNDHDSMTHNSRIKHVCLCMP